jgi:hypothetical protein
MPWFPLSDGRLLFVYLLRTVLLFLQGEFFMKTFYDPDLKAHVSVDEEQRVRHIRHSDEFPLSEEDSARAAADSYLTAMAETLQIPQDSLRNLNRRRTFFAPREQEVEYQLSEEKHLFDSVTVAYDQTYKNVPIWRRGIAVKVKQNPNRVVAATNNTETGIQGELPADATIERHKTVFRQAIARAAARAAGLGAEEDSDVTAAYVRKILKLRALRAARNGASEAHGETRVMSGKFFFYKYDPQRRYAGKPAPSAGDGRRELAEEEHGIPLPKLPDVAESIVAGQSYLVAEVIFTDNSPGYDGLVWLMLVEVETDSVLYIECMTCGVNGLVFRRDPIVKTGDLTITSDDAIAALNLQRDDVLLTNLVAPIAGTQHLTGTFIDIEALMLGDTAPNVAPATMPSGSDFDFDTRSDNFGAVNAYYHLTELFRTIESLGFPIASYFDGTTFPIPVDHRSLGNQINAHWAPNGGGGTGHMCYGLCDTTNTANPLLRAVDPWVHWHEMGGHGTLGDHVGGGTFGFCHSAGDGLAAIQMDPESQLRALGMPERFRYAPFRPFTTERRFDRPVATWAWGGPNDDEQYGSEQILATCHFRIYHSIGGDHANLGRRQFASRATTYLILRAIGNLTPGTNPSNFDPVTMMDVPGRGAELWCEELQDTDLENWTSEGLSGGAYNKVIRWAFEKQGSYQPAGASANVTTAGAPPAVDVYIEDGRGGEYQFQAVHWQNMSMWNRNSPDALPTHQNAIAATTNFMYGKVKNRGTTTATNVTVRCYHCLPGAGLTWPTDFTEMGPVGGITIPSIGANNSQEVMVGPFEWTPNVNALGHDCVLMIASTAGDPSNIDHFTGTETIAEWRLVPNDNNIGQRNVVIVPGVSPESLVAAFDNAIFFAGNSFNKRASMELRVELPDLLTAKSWKLHFAEIDNGQFQLRPGAKRAIKMRLAPGDAFSADEIRQSKDRHINVYLSGNGIEVGGMSYQIDPDAAGASGEAAVLNVASRRAALNLLERLNLPAAQPVGNVRIRKVSVDIEFE